MLTSKVIKTVFPARAGGIPGQTGKAESIKNIIKTKIAAHSARSLSHNAQGLSSQNETAISLFSI